MLLDPCPKKGAVKSLFVCLSIHQFGIFLRIGSLVFSDILDDGREMEYLKTEPFFPGKFMLAQIWTKRAQNGPKIGFFGFFEKFCC